MVLFSPAAHAEEEIPFETAIRPLMVKYCTECHDADVTKGDLNLDRFTTRDQAIDSLAIWQRAGMRIENKEMPPRKEDNQPTDEERALITKWIGTLQVDEADCNMIANEESVAWYSGDVMSRRLNRIEYEYTLRDLLGRGKVQGPMVHDARIAVLCLTHGVRELWSADRDFSRFPDLHTRNPLV